ncbi:hydrogenase maturation nickel metallochaperone HypA [Tropicimonas sp. IMCC6043]|uniref:hydrogenase maturation nickel metallochaperone HypA n=1 Tax=Tropicimonas sp. IMCC6043 TaxID=2510645 RepID=UPI00101D4753|nr:hydrogenase maturation nickel metallochaperone HypA [Tropicimonas sp. IMCC6043]RYH10807.1 hydrogenase maturation nickel metallochaperone HypA [Tropicimonas sp. IMCC6043]
MHEVGLARSIFAMVAERAGGRPVSCVRLSLGPLACVEPSALAFSWQVLTEGTALDGAALQFLDGEGDSLVVREFEFAETV